jgi:hypothetical protein
MADFPYTQVTGKLTTLFSKIQHVGPPPTVNKNWLASIGFGASNDQSVVPVLKFIGFVDSSSKPTETWMAYRDSRRAKAVMADAIVDGYSELFQVYPDAYQRSDDDLRNFFRTRTRGGAQVVNKTVTTFKNLSKLADFRSTQVPSDERPPEITEVERPRSNIVVSDVTPNVSTGITLNINIQLTVPDTTDEAVYDKFFAALKKHLLP